MRDSLRHRWWQSDGAVNASYFMATIGVGLAFGFVFPTDASIAVHSVMAARVSSIVGWTYFTAWSVR